MKQREVLTSIRVNLSLEGVSPDDGPLFRLSLCRTTAGVGVGARESFVEAAGGIMMTRMHATTVTGHSPRPCRIGSESRP